MPKREDHEVRKGHVGHWIKKFKILDYAAYCTYHLLQYHETVHFLHKVQSRVSCNYQYKHRQFPVHLLYVWRVPKQCIIALSTSIQKKEDINTS